MIFFHDMFRRVAVLKAFRHFPFLFPFVCFSLAEVIAVHCTALLLLDPNAVVCTFECEL